MVQRKNNMVEQHVGKRIRKFHIILKRIETLHEHVKRTLEKGGRVALLVRLWW